MLNVEVEAELKVGPTGCGGPRIPKSGHGKFTAQLIVEAQVPVVEEPVLLAKVKVPVVADLLGASTPPSDSSFSFF